MFYSTTKKNNWNIIQYMRLITKSGCVGVKLSVFWQGVGSLLWWREIFKRRSNRRHWSFFHFSPLNFFFFPFFSFFFFSKTTTTTNKQQQTLYYGSNEKQGKSFIITKNTL
jgi:hypothetical protein